MAGWGSHRSEVCVRRESQEASGASLCRRLALFSSIDRSELIISSAVPRLIVSSHLTSRSRCSRVPSHRFGKDSVSCSTRHNPSCCCSYEEPPAAIGYSPRRDNCNDARTSFGVLVRLVRRCLRALARSLTTAHTRPPHRHQTTTTITVTTITTTTSGDRKQCANWFTSSTPR